MATFQHESVLLEESIKALKVDPRGTYVDCTLGGGGHSRQLLDRLDEKGQLIAFDQDQWAINNAKERFKTEIKQGKLLLVEENFSQIKQVLQGLGFSEVAGVLYDLGVSSPQFDQAGRGFSYRYDAPLDMRMNQDQALSARDVVNTWSFQELYHIIRDYGEERFAKGIARAIEKNRQQAPIETTFQLVAIIKEAIPAAARRTGGHPAKQTFQAIRIAVNQEFSVLETSLAGAADLLRPGGRIACITFHSLEDGLVARRFKAWSRPPRVPKNLPVAPGDLPQAAFRMQPRKAIRPSAEEIAKNRRARSARLRVLERLPKES